ncbi:PH domain-containing protein [Dactylosporangium sp. NPDC005555]|uniref:PH domain-containing protein n=1 Tax=Dactylosporangium sp. NPDC005555 TaxID=3154889 RepID=UPI0033B1A048
MSTGPEPSAEEPGARRWEDRDTEPIPRARPTSSDADDYADADPYNDGAQSARLGGYGRDDYYVDEGPPTFTEDEFSGLRGGDSGPPVPPGSRMAPLDEEASRHAARYLFPTEKFRGEWKRHWIQLAKEGGIAVAATIAMGYIAGWLTKHNQTQLRTAVLVIWAIVILYCAWRVADWWYDRFILTNKRVMVVSGIFTRNVAMMPLLRVTDMKYVQSLTGRMFGYGHFELESAGQDQALRNIRNLPNPNELYLRIVEEMYEPEAVEARLGRAAGVEDDGT